MIGEKGPLMLSVAKHLINPRTSFMGFFPFAPLRVRMSE